MCGIFGYTGLVEVPGLLENMGEVQTHRGPDDVGYYVDQEARIHFGLRRLSIIDLEGGHQPVSNEDQTVWAACNGEIYNYLELRKDLIGQGHSFKTHSDVEVLVHLYEEYGDDFLTRLNGMFGIVLYDRNRQRLLLARDRIGIKPLYYAWDGQRLVFASEIKSILKCPWVSREPDWQGISSYLHLFYIPAPRTGFAEIRKLDSGTIAVLENSGLKTSRYWRLNDYLDIPGRPAMHLQEAAEELLCLLKDAARLQLRSDVPVGAFLSGGVDSSAVVSLTNREENRGMDTFTVAWQGARDKIDERDYARQVAELYGCSSHEKLIDWEDFNRLLPFLAWHLEEPNADGAYVPTYMISAFARQRSKVILTGAGGDELFGGYGFYDRQMSAAYNILKACSGILGCRHRDAYLRRAFRFPWKWVLNCYQGGVEEEFLSPYDRLSGSDALNREMAFDLEVYLQDNILLLTDKMSMAASLEARVPLLDHRIVEFVAGLPSSLKISQNEKKVIFKQAMKGLLPDNILYRRKDGFGAPVSSWMQGPLKGLILPLLENGQLMQRGLLDRTAFKRLAGLTRARTSWGWSYWVLLNLELWFRFVVEDTECPRSVKLSDLN